MYCLNSEFMILPNIPNSQFLISLYSKTWSLKIRAKIGFGLNIFYSNKCVHGKYKLKQ